jgi:hypothetical protein
MLSENRVFHFIGTLTLNKSHLLGKNYQPRDDKVNWLFLNIEGAQYSFIYKIKKPLEAQYGQPFKAELAFTAIQMVKNIVRLNYPYQVSRGQEIIGTVKLICPL